MDYSREQFKTNKGRCAERDTLNAEIQTILKEKWTLQEIVSQMTIKGIPFSEIKSAA
jgi:crotonobetainyl-CoA:carnitine CoA-transferase CaiB-like acyl-CoA transferase